LKIYWDFNSETLQKQIVFQRGDTHISFDINGALFVSKSLVELYRDQSKNLKLIEQFSFEVEDIAVDLRKFLCGVGIYSNLEFDSPGFGLRIKSSSSNSDSIEFTRTDDIFGISHKSSIHDYNYSQTRELFFETF
jgi:hypothetical protein